MKFKRIKWIAMMLVVIILSGLCAPMSVSATSDDLGIETTMEKETDEEFALEEDFVETAIEGSVENEEFADEREDGAEDVPGEKCIEEYIQEVESGLGEIYALQSNGEDTATYIELNSWYTDNLENDSDVNRYEFEIPSEGQIYLEFEHEKITPGTIIGLAKGWKTCLYDSNNKKLADYNFFDNSMYYQEAKIGVDAGSYYLLVYKHPYYASENYSIKINYSKSSGNWESETNDNYDVADAISIDETYHGNLGHSSDIDWYKFDVPEDVTSMKIVVDHGYINSKHVYWKVYLYNSSLKQIALYAVQGDRILSEENEDLEKGTYYIKVTENYTSDLPYSLKISLLYKHENVYDHVYDNNVDGTCNGCGINRETVEVRQVVHMFRMYNPNTGEHFYTGSDVEKNNLIVAGWQYEGIGFTFPANTGAPVHRLFQSSTGEHLYTMNEAEKDSLIADGWNYEGIAFNSAYDTEAVQYRLHNPNATCGAYHFTFSQEERQNLLNAGWEDQGIGWYSCWK